MYKKHHKGRSLISSTFKCLTVLIQACTILILNTLVSTDKDGVCMRRTKVKHFFSPQTTNCKIYWEKLKKGAYSRMHPKINVVLSIYEYLRVRFTLH